MTMKKLITSTFNFPKLIQGNFLYVDKTEYLWKLIESGKGQYFLSRPRRFGKSLTISTLDAIFQGKRELFEGLAIYEKDYEWKKYPVIHIDFSDCSVETPAELREYLWTVLKELARKFHVTLKYKLLSPCFNRLIQDIAGKGKVVILVDEYDKPILGNVMNSKAPEILKVLKGFYSNIKKTEGLQRFALITGVSKFCQVSVFSDLNNLTDITLRNDFDALLGFTKEELLAYFGERIDGIAAAQKIGRDTLINNILQWYDGYRFSETEKRVCNPVSITSFFINDGIFRNYWHDTGTPSFLLELARNTRFDLEAALVNPVSEDVFMPYELDNMDTLGLLWQTGYLTIKEVTKGFLGESLYRLDFPNLEVRQSFLKEMLSFYAGYHKSYTGSLLNMILNAVMSNNISEFMKLLKVSFANMPCSIKVKDEKYFQSLFYQLFLLIGANIEAECCTNDGRVDAVIKTPTHVYIFEFKLDRGAADAMTQIIDKRYYLKYQSLRLPIVMIGANFDYEAGQLTEWKEMPVPYEEN